MRKLIVSELRRDGGAPAARRATPTSDEGFARQSHARPCVMPHSLIDEYRLMVFPVVIGSGRRLFPEAPDKTVLQLADTQAFDSGVVVHTYRPGGSPR